MRITTASRAAAIAIVVANVATSQVVQAGKARYGSFGVDLTARDPRIAPGDDFWAYANGSWDAKTQIPADKGSTGVGNLLADEAEADIRKILDDMSANPAKYGASGKQVGDFYASWMNAAAIETRGTTPLRPYLARIDAVKNLADLQTLFASVGYASPVGMGIIPSLSDPTHYTAAVGQGGLGMPRDYYLLTGAKYDGFRAAYRSYIQTILELTGVESAKTKADAIMALETAMAKEQWSPEKSRDIAALNDPQDIAGLETKAPEFEWALMLKTAGLDQSPKVLMGNNTALTAMGKILVATPIDTWKDYLTFHFVSDNAQYLPKRFDDAAFDFFSKTLSGVQVQRDRWKRGVALTNGALGEAVGALYVAQYYPPESEKQMAELIENLRAAYHERISKSSWMDDATRAAALKKLAAFEPRIGHPAKYVDYSTFKVDRNDLLGNAIRSAEFQHHLEVQRFPNPVDRTL